MAGVADTSLAVDAAGIHAVPVDGTLVRRTSVDVRNKASVAGDLYKRIVIAGLCKAAGAESLRVVSAMKHLETTATVTLRQGAVPVAEGEVLVTVFPRKTVVAPFLNQRAKTAATA